MSTLERTVSGSATLGAPALLLSMSGKKFNKVKFLQLTDDELQGLGTIVAMAVAEHLASKLISERYS